MAKQRNGQKQEKAQRRCHEKSNEMETINYDIDPRTGKRYPTSIAFWTAAHVAGLAVVGLSLGRTLQGIWVRGESGAANFVPPDPCAPDAVERFLASGRGASAPDDPFRREWEARWATGLVLSVAGPLHERLDYLWQNDEQTLTEAQLAEADASMLEVNGGRVDLEGGMHYGLLARYAPGRLGSWGSEGWRVALLAEALGELTGRAWADHVIWAEQQACEILAAQWSAVQRLATSLCRRQSGRMTAGQVRALLRDDPVRPATLTSLEGVPLARSEAIRE